MRIHFKDIEYSVQLPNKESLEILKGVRGSFQSGRLVAILGQSGSGKTTLLDILSQRKTEGLWSGTIELNGSVISSKDRWRKICGYVQQHDKLLSTATIFEALMFSILLRTSFQRTYESQVERVKEIVKEIGLSHRMDARIGDESNRSLSGGEMRRVSIAQELVAEVKVLLLDEPTSGLDSASAIAIVALLKKIAISRDAIVVATVHQPSSSMANIFDDVMIMAHGKVCFNDEWSKVIQFLDHAGHPVPGFTNPADHIIELTAREETTRDLIDLTIRNSDVLLYQSSKADDKLAFKSIASPFWFQFKLVWIRQFRHWFRSPILFISELTQYIFAGLFIGMMYHGLPSTLEAGIFDRSSAIFFILTTLCFVPSFTVVTIAAEEFPLLKREINSGMYSITSSYMAKLATTWPFEMFLSLVFVLCSYWIVGFEPGSFFVFYLIVLLFQLISETIGLLCAQTTPNATVGVLLLSLVLLVCLAIGGFLVSQPKIWYSWFESINFFSYAYTAIIHNQFESLELFDPSTNSTVNGLDYIISVGRVSNSLSMWGNIGVLFAMLVILRILAYFIFVFQLQRSSFRRKSASVARESSSLGIK